ncbi:MAG: type II secretion system F family protein [Armatimonadetes bacterium]|nr:type II secretion system F family protein [Armatimonadota bacterium]
MPHFRYRALDRTGRHVDGGVDAHDANSAVQQLSQRGLRIQSIEEGVQLVHTPKPKQKAVALNRLPDQAPAVRVVARKTKPSDNSEVFFLFAQLSNLLRGGIAPVDALTTINGRNRNKKFDGPLSDMAAMTAEGAELSTALEHYPDLFAPGVVGAVRAGERGGYLPEACQVISEQAHETHKLQRVYWWLGAVLILMAFTFAAAMAGGTGIERAIDSINNPNDPDNTVLAGITAALLGPVGLALILFFALYFGTKMFLRRTASRAKRHAIALKTPLVGQRASSESLALFAWHLNKLGKAGLSPFASWNLAASAVPNIAFSDRLIKVGSGMGEATRFSALFYNSDLFSHEISAMMETGEMTGQIGPALDQAMDYSRAEQKTADTMLKAKAGCWAMLLLTGGGMIAFLLLYVKYLTSAFKVLE